MMPLVSIIMPLFNAASTVQLALASLQAQTCDDWECIVVDDGSTDNSEEVVKGVADIRVKYYPLRRNCGRGYARQVALDRVRGRFVTFLDADDWIYPNKLSQQLELLYAEPQIAIVSTGMAISDSTDSLLGVRTPRPKSVLIHLHGQRLRMPPLAFAPSMMSTDLAKTIGFDTSFPIAEDVDFLLRALYDRPYSILPAPLYVYRETHSMTYAKVNSALTYCCRMFKKQFQRHPIQSSIQIAQARAKQAGYWLASTVGMWKLIIALRSQSPTASERQQYQTALAFITKMASGYSMIAPACNHRSPAYELLQ